MPRRGSPESVYTVSDSEGSEYESAPQSTSKRRRVVVSKPKRSAKSDGGALPLPDLEDAAAACIARPHAKSYHGLEGIEGLQEGLLSWFEGVRGKRGMPWRKRYDPSLSMEEKSQRAYEIWVSEVMLQQTQVATVIAYWTRWIDKWPTIADLAKADIEQVNSAWRGLGYYRRARSLLAGAKTVMGNSKYHGRLPEDPAMLEKEIDGIGRYTAGAICSMAYGVSTPIVDGNIHRLFTRLLAIHAPQTAPGTIKLLWQVAEQLVHHLPQDHGIAGDWNQALMELGSQVCKPVNPDCEACPLQRGCKAYMELSRAPDPPSSSTSSRACEICAPIPTTSTSAGSVIPSVTVFPMRKEKKASRVEEEVVGVVEWRGAQGRRWLMTKRPEKGLLAGLFEPPTTPVAASASAEERLDASLATLSDLLDVSPTDITPRYIGSIPHIFSHIDMTYHIQHLVIATTALPTISAGGQERNAVWLDESGVEHANVGTGVKKVWAEVYGSWGRFEVGVKVASKPAKKAKKVDKDRAVGGKVVKKIMMPLMPRKAEI